MNQWPRLLESALRIFLGAVFVYASWDKIVDPTAFAQAIANYQLLPSALIAPAALWLPWIEMVSGLCLISGRFKHGSAAIVLMLLLIFTAALGYNLYRGLDVTCGCFSTNADGGKSDLVVALLRDLVLVGMALTLLMRISVDRTSDRK